MVAHALIGRPYCRWQKGSLHNRKPSIWIMEQLLYGNTESSSTGTHGAAPSFCSTRSTEQLQWSITIMDSETTCGSSAGHTYTAETEISFSEHVQLLHRSTWIEQPLPWRTRSSSASARGAARLSGSR